MGEGEKGDGVVGQGVGDEADGTVGEGVALDFLGEDVVAGDGGVDEVDGIDAGEI